MNGQVFQRTYRAADGTTKTCATWAIRYYRNGKPYQEATKYTRKTDAQNLLKRRAGDIAHGKSVNPAHLKMTFDEAVADVINDYKANGKRSLDDVVRRIQKHLLPYFGGRRMSELSGTDIRAYIAQRQAARLTIQRAHAARRTDGTARLVAERRRTIAGVSNGTINRELQIVKRAFSLAIKDERLHTGPHIPMLRESAPRAGFFERAQLEAVQRHLPETLRGLVGFAYITGWRVPSEVQPLEWRQVDFAAGTVRLDPGTTKNGDGRLFPMTAEVRRILEDQRTYTDTVQRARKAVVPFVFHRDGGSLSAPSRRRGEAPVWLRAALDAFRTTSAARPCATSYAPAYRRKWR